ncbi:MAG: ParA family protein [Bellilinea sp.]
MVLTVVHLAYYFAQRRDRVLVVDLDTQGHIALSYDQLRGDALRDILLQRRSISDVRIKARPNLWIVPNSKSLVVTHQGLEYRPLKGTLNPGCR